MLIIALASGKEPSRGKIATPFDSAMPPLPEDPNNPYYSPQADQRKPPEDSPPPGF